MKLILPLIAFIILSTHVLADIGVDVDKPVYNFGGLIQASYIVSTDSDLSGLAELSLICEENELKFYTLPTSLFAGQSQSVSVPGSGVPANMAGTCYISASVSSFDNLINESASSNYFNITPNLSVVVTLEQATLKPGEELVISGFVGKSHSSRSSVSLSFLGDLYASPAINNSFI